MPGLVPGIHVLHSATTTWMAGTSPAMTRNSQTGDNFSGPACRLSPPSFVLWPRAGMEKWNEELELSLGHCRRGRPVGMRRHRRHVFAAGAAAADRAGHRLVGGGYFQRHDHRLPGDGLR